MRTHYDLLGVTPDASTEEIRAAYRRRAQLVHPDQHVTSSADVRREAERVMADVNEAWSVLKDPEHRRRYDDALRRFNIDDPTYESQTSDSGELLQRARWLLDDALRHALDAALANALITEDAGYREVLNVLAYAAHELLEVALDELASAVNDEQAPRVAVRNSLAVSVRPVVELYRQTAPGDLSQAAPVVLWMAVTAAERIDVEGVPASALLPFPLADSLVAEPQSRRAGAETAGGARGVACDVCGARPAYPGTFHQHKGMLLFWRHASYPGNFCVLCATVLYRECMRRTAVAGWWSFLSPFIAGFSIIRNEASIRSILRAARRDSAPVERVGPHAAWLAFAVAGLVVAAAVASAVEDEGRSASASSGYSTSSRSPAWDVGWCVLRRPGDSLVPTSCFGRNDGMITKHATTVAQCPNSTDWFASDRAGGVFCIDANR